MKTIRRPILMISSVAALSLGAWHLQAQEKPAPKAAPQSAQVETRPGPMKPGGREARPGLTADQRAQLSTLREQQREKLRAIREDVTLSAEQKREKARALSQTGRTEAEAIFTPEQKEKMQQARQQMRQRMHHAMRARMHHRAAGWHERRAGFGQHFGRGMHHGPRPQNFSPGQGHGPRMGHGFAPERRGRPGPMGMGPGGPGGQGRDFGRQPQGPGDRGPGWGAQPGRPGDFAGLELTDAQKANVQALRQQQQEKMAESMKSFQEQFRALLTPEQQQKLDARRGGPGQP